MTDTGTLLERIGGAQNRGRYDEALTHLYALPDTMREGFPVIALEAELYGLLGDHDRELALYDRLIELDDSPVAALNRAVALANVRGPRAGIEAVETITGRPQLDCYYLLYAVLGEFEADLNHRETAMQHFRKAL